MDRHDVPILSFHAIERVKRTFRMVYIFWIQTTRITAIAEDELAHGIPCLMGRYLCFFPLLFVTSLLCILGTAEEKLCFKRVGKFN